MQNAELHPRIARQLEAKREVLENVKKVVVDESVVEHKSEPYLIYETPPAAPRVAAAE